MCPIDAGNAAAMREALEKLVAHLDKEVALTKKCNRCKYNGKSFRGEPCNWHVDCGIEDYELKASDAAKFLLNKFKLRAALSTPPRNCDVGTAEEQAERFAKVCTANSKDGVRGLCSEACPFGRDYQSECALAWAQMPYKERGAK